MGDAVERRRVDAVDAQLQRQADGAKVILLADDLNVESIVDTIRSGVKAVLPTDVTSDKLIAAIHAVDEELIVVPDEGFLTLIRTPHSPASSLVEPLTKRESEILSAMADGRTNKDIAARLKISEHTVKFHVATILSKLGATGRTEAVSIAMRQGLIMI